MVKAFLFFFKLMRLMVTLTTSFLKKPWMSQEEKQKLCDHVDREFERLYQQHLLKAKQQKS